MVLAPTYVMLSDSTFRSFLSIATSLKLISPGGIKNSPPPSVKLVNGSEILFRSADDPERLRGPNLSGIWMDEASLMKEDVFKIAIGRLRAEGRQGWLSATFTPKGKQHWTYKIFATGAPDSFIRRIRTKDNPFLSKTFVGTLTRIYGQGQFARQELGGEFTEGDGRFNPDWFKKTRYRVGNDYFILGERNIDFKKCTRFGTCDPAASSKQTAKTDDPDWTVISAWASTPENELLWLHCHRFRAEVPDILKEIQDIYDSWKLTTMHIETCGANRAVYQFMRRSRMAVRSMETLGIGKLERATPAIILAETGRIWLPEQGPHQPKWLDVAEDELFSFTGDEKKDVHDDIVDAMSMAAKVQTSKDMGNGFAPYVATPSRNAIGVRR